MARVVVGICALCFCVNALGEPALPHGWMPLNGTQLRSVERRDMPQLGARVGGKFWGALTQEVFAQFLVNERDGLVAMHVEAQNHRRWVRLRNFGKAIPEQEYGFAVERVSRNNLIWNCRNGRGECSPALTQKITKLCTGDGLVVSKLASTSWLYCASRGRFRLIDTSD